MCSKDSGNQSPILIDFTHYKAKSLTFYDYAYLEFDLLLKMMPAETEGEREAWFEFGRYLARTLDLPPDLPGGPQVETTRKLICALRARVLERCDTENQVDSFTSAYLIASTAAALNYFRKVSSDNARKLALLVAAQYLQSVLYRCHLQPSAARRIAEIQWVGMDRKQLDLQVQETCQRLRCELVPALMERRALLILGPEFARWVGFPTERWLAEKVAKELGLAVGVLADSDDPANFAPLLAASRDTDRIHVCASKNYVADLSRWVKCFLSWTH